MRKLATQLDPVRAGEVLRRLREASIVAIMTTEGDIAGMPSCTLWIGDDEDGAAALRILESTRGLDTHARCPQCGYDLQGHGGHVTCPECGFPTEAPAGSVDCPACGEPVPVHFQVCWSCGADMPEAGAGPTTPPSPDPR